MALINIALSALDEFIGMSSTPYANALAVRSLLDLIRGQRQGPDADKANVLLASDARWYAKLLELSRPQDASALGASSSWAFCTLLGATVRTAPHHLLAKHMAHWMDHLVQHLRAADLRTRLAAALCSTAIIVRACAVGADTRRDAISVGQRLVQPHLNVLTACATTPDRLAAVNSLAEVAVAAPSLIKTLGPKILSALFALFDAETPAEARLARAAGRCAGRVAAAVYGSASVNGVAQFVVSALGSLHGVFGAVFDGCEDPAVNASVTPLWRATVESCGFAELRAMSPAAVDTPLAAQSRVAALCEAVVAAVTSTFPIPQQHLQQVQQQKLAAGIVLPTEAVVDLIRRFTSVNMDTIVKFRSTSAAPAFRLLGLVSFFHNIAYKLLETVIVLHGRSVFPFLGTAVMGVITQGLWLCYRAPTPIASADVKASLFRCASAAVRVAGSGGAACVAQPLVPFIRAELEGLYGDLQAGSERRANSGGGSSFATAAAALSALEAVLAACGDLLPAATQEEVAHLMAVLLRSPAPGALGSAVSRCAALCSVSCAGALVALLPMAGMAVAGVSACDSVAAREALYAGAMCEGSIHPRVSPVCVAPPVSRRTTTPVTTTDDVVVDDDSTVRFSHSASTPATAIVGTVFAGQKPEYKPLEFASTTTTSSSSTAAAATVTNASVTENKSKECDKSTHLNDTASMLEFLNPKPAKSFSIVVPEHEHDEPEPKPEPEDKHEEESMGIVACNNSEAVEEKEAKVKEGNKVVIAIREEESVVMEDHEPEIKKQKTETVPKSQPQLDVAELALMDVGPDEEDEDLDDDDDDEFN